MDERHHRTPLHPGPHGVCADSHHNGSDEIVLTPNVTDDIRCWWSASGEFTSRSAYQAFFLGQVAIHGAKELWQVKASNKCKFLVWLLLHGRVWTSERLHRFGLNDNDSCALCAQESETVDHLFLTCVYNRETWFKALRRFQWHQLAPQNNGSLVGWWLQS